MPGIEEKQNTFRVRQINPDAFDADSFRIIKITDGVNAVIGKTKQNKGDNMNWEEKAKELEIKLNDANAKITELESKVTETEEKAAKAEEKFSAEEQAHIETKASIEKAKIEAQAAKENEFVDGLIKARKLKPADKELTLVTLEKLRDANEIEFTDAEGNKQKKAAQTQYMENLDAVEPFVSDSEDFTDGTEANKDAKLSKLAKARMEEKNISLSHATQEIIAENPSLA